MTRSSSRPALVAAAFALAGAAVASGARADPVYTQAGTDFTGGSAMFGYLGQQYTFTDVSNGAFTFDSVAVTTAPGAAVSSLGLPFYDPPQPSTFFDPIRGSGTLFFDGSTMYSGFARTVIAGSATPTFIGLALTLGDGVHYGFARFAGTYLVSYAFESAAGIGIDVASTIAPPVPEPETYALMLAGLAAVGAIARRRRGERR